MTNRDDDIIADSLGLEPLSPNELMPQAKPPVKKDVDGEQDLQNDFQYARENLYNIIERGTDALNGIVDLANQSQHPRSFEVVADLVRTLSTANKDLLDLQKKMKDMHPEDKGPSKVTNNLFVGSTKDLTALMQGKARQIKEIDNDG